MSNSNGSLNQGGDGNKSGGSLPAIIGGVVGGVLGLLAIIALIWYLLRRREQTRFMFDDDDDDMGGGKGGVYGAAAGMAGGRRGRTRSVNLEDEIKGADAHPYQYGLVGNTPSPHGSPAFHSQNSTMGYGTAHSGGHHQRNSSRDALMASGPASPSLSPRHLDVLLPIGQRRASQLTGSSSGAPDSIMMTNQQPMTHAVTNNNLGNRPSDERDAPWMGHHARPSSSLLEAPTTYPPGHNGFYQQYGPVEPAQPAQQRPPSASTTGGGSITGGGGVHKPPLEPSLAAAMRPVPAHQALYYAAGLQDPNSPLTHSNTMSSSRTQAHVMATPPPGAGGARQYPLSASTSVGASSVPGPGLGLGHAPNREGDIFSAVMASADHAAATATASPTPGAASPGEFGFGRQRRDGEKSPTPSSGPRSPVIQHRDGGRVPVGQQPSGEAPPPAYTDP
ncbi:hypothetical protein M408DRAFT_6047 [Serendipita vermifera MAFF 305830]|uniref:Uncharacterized protein n=1 Tax=Serendipita vermifera MAFF 305830 TaxID=933852 RepID=A0A0C2XXN3_SERVB|nr:hypothetical protein M408DRAFT_6047 [Serendipita vermifera MAFF 305830]